MRRFPLLVVLALCLALLPALAPATTHAEPAQSHHGRYYVVGYGDTLSGIGMRYGYSAWHLASYNGLANANMIYVGQVLHLPPSHSGGAPASGGHYVVKRGDTLSGIAAAYGTSVSHLMAVNGLRSTMIYVGQHLVIHGGGGADMPHTGARHCVRHGDTLWGIAHFYGLSVHQLMWANGLTSHTIYVGQCLTVRW